jgi:hypothetical protein
MTDGPELDLGLSPLPLKVTHWRPRWSVEAVRLTADGDWQVIADWCDGTLGEQGDASGLHPAIRVWTDHGSVWATEGNWIVKDGRLPKVCEASFFADFYEQVAE